MPEVDIPSKPKVSVVIPSFNHANYIGDCIRSILDQTYQDFEIIITDDGSSDNSVEIIRQIEDPRLRLLTFSENHGACTALNHCIQNSQGEYIAVMNSDDVWEPEKLILQVAYLNDHPDIGAVFSKVNYIDDDGLLLPMDDPRFYRMFETENCSRGEWLKYFFYSGNCLCHPSVLIRKECYDVVGLYDERMANLPDFDMWIRLCLHFNIHVMDRKLVRYRVRADSANVSANKPSSHIRSLFEYSLILNHYLDIPSTSTLLEIFPEAEQFKPTTDVDVHYVLGRLALITENYWRYLWGLNVLWKLLGSPDSAKRLDENFGFRYIDFYYLTGRYDVYKAEPDQGILDSQSALDSKLDTIIQSVKDKVSTEPEDFADGLSKLTEELISFQRTQRNRRENQQILLTELNQKIARLTDLLEDSRKESAQLRSDIENIFHSKSWKLSAPFRLVSTFIYSSLGQKK